LDRRIITIDELCQSNDLMVANKLNADAGVARLLHFEPMISARCFAARTASEFTPRGRGLLESGELASSLEQSLSRRLAPPEYVVHQSSPHALSHVLTVLGSDGSLRSQQVPIAPDLVMHRQIGVAWSPRKDAIARRIVEGALRPLLLPTRKRRR